MNTKTSRSKNKAPPSRLTRKVPAAGKKSRTKSNSARASTPPPKSATKARPKTLPPSGAVAAAVRGDSVRLSKQARLIALLQAAPGATIERMMALTGWQAHTVRGTISGVLRKKMQLNVTCARAVDSGAHRYRIVGRVAGT